MIYLANIVRLVFSIYIMLIFIRVIFAWLKPNMFNPIVRFVYGLTDPYLRLFARVRFLRVGMLDFTPLLAFYILYLMMELSYNMLIRGYISPELLISLIVVLLFRFIYFILFIFLIAVGLRLILEIIGFRTNNLFSTIVYSLSEPAVRPLQHYLRLPNSSGFDFNVVVSLAIIILLRFFLLPRLLALITKLLGQ